MKRNLIANFALTKYGIDKRIKLVNASPTRLKAFGFIQVGDELWTLDPVRLDDNTLFHLLVSQDEIIRASVIRYSHDHEDICYGHYIPWQTYQQEHGKNVDSSTYFQALTYQHKIDAIMNGLQKLGLISGYKSGLWMQGKREEPNE